MRATPESPPVSTGGLFRVPCWLWPNLLALDAPAVAVVWQRFVAGPQPPAVPLALFLTVWGVYLADRRLDARRGAAGTDRHRFAAARPRLLAGLAAAALVGAAVAALAVPTPVQVAGLVLAVGVGGYFAAVHLGLLPAAAKEPLVGGLFAAGVLLPQLVADPAGSLPPLVAYGGLAALNCELITRWEGGRHSPGRTAAAAVVAAGGAVLCQPPVTTAVLAAVGLLGLLHLTRRRLGPRPLRVLADAALLTPLPAVV